MPKIHIAIQKYNDHFAGTICEYPNLSFISKTKSDLIKNLKSNLCAYLEYCANNNVLIKTIDVVEDYYVTDKRLSDAHEK